MSSIERTPCPRLQFHNWSSKRRASRIDGELQRTGRRRLGLQREVGRAEAGDALTEMLEILLEVRDAGEPIGRLLHPAPGRLANSARAARSDSRVSGAGRSPHRRPSPWAGSHEGAGRRRLKPPRRSRDILRPSVLGLPGDVGEILEARDHRGAGGGPAGAISSDWIRLRALGRFAVASVRSPGPIVVGSRPRLPAGSSVSNSSARFLASSSRVRWSAALVIHARAGVEDEHSEDGTLGAEAEVLLKHSGPGDGPG